MELLVVLPDVPVQRGRDEDVNVDDKVVRSRDGLD